MNEIKRRRTELGYRLVDVACLADLSIGEVWNLEQGLSHRARPETRKKLAKALQMPVKELFPES